MEIRNPANDFFRTWLKARNNKEANIINLVKNGAVAFIADQVFHNCKVEEKQSPLDNYIIIFVNKSEDSKDLDTFIQKMKQSRCKRCVCNFKGRINEAKSLYSNLDCITASV